MSETKFTVVGKKLIIERSFNAAIDLVWRAWTEADLLDQWWAPKPWRSETHHMDFREGGYRLYAMVGPQGEKHWGRTNFLSITPLAWFSGEDVFCDDQGIVDPEMPVANMRNVFRTDGTQTTVLMTTDYPTEEQLQTVIKMGVQEGLGMAFENLDQLLVNLRA